MELLEKLLIDLHGSIDSEEVRVDAASLVANIEAFAFGDMDATDLAYSASLLLKSTSPPSLIVFLTDSSRAKDKEIISAKKQALKFMAAYAKVLPEVVAGFAEEVITTLMELFKKETSGEVKACLLLPVKNLLRGTLATRRVVSLDLDQMYRVLVDELNQSPSKISKGMRCEGLKTLGLLVAVYPAEGATVEAVTRILPLCEGVLQTNFAKNAKEVDFSAIAGAFSCLDRCLGHFEDRCGGGKGGYGELWRCLLQTVMAATAADTSRYAACSKAARLVAHHAELFRGLIGLNAQQSVRLLESMHAAGKKALTKHSAPALQALLRQLAAHVVEQGSAGGGGGEEKGEGEAVRTIRALYGQYMAVVEAGGGAGSGGQEALMGAVQGLGAIAPAVVALLGRQGMETSGSGCGAGKGLDSVQGALDKIVSAARHQVRHAETLALGGDSSSGGSGGSGAAEDNGTTSSSSAVAGGQERLGGLGEEGEGEDAGQGSGADLPLQYRKVLFLNAVTSFLSAASTQSETGGASSCCSPAVMAFVEEFAVDALVAYSRLWTKQQVLVTQTLCTLAHALLHLPLPPEASATSPAPALARLLECVSAGLLLRTVSRRGAGEGINPAQARLSEFTGQGEDRLLFAYLDLWRELLHPADRQVVALLMRHYEPSYAQGFAQRLYDALLLQMLQLLGSLDLSYEAVVGAEGVAGQAAPQDRVLLPSNMADQDVLLNLVTFLELFLPLAEQWFPGRLAAFLPQLTARVVPLAQALPLLSGLYRLLHCFTRVLGQGAAGAGALSLGSGSGSGAEELVPLRNLLLSVQHRAATSAGDFTQELLDAALSLVLSAPSCHLLSLAEVVPALRLSLTSGVQALRSVSLLTEMALRDLSVVEPHLPTLLPLLDSYLSSGPVEGRGGARMFLKSQAALSRLVRGQGGGGGGTESSSYASQVQGAVLELLGRLGGLAQHVILPASETVHDALVWAEKECLCFTLPAEGGGGVQLCLDAVLPRLVALCEAVGSGSLDPQLLSAAAETLHALLTFMIGSASAVAANRAKVAQFTPYYERVFPVVIRLASAPDLACAGLFEKLLLQCVRWFSGFGQVHEKDAAALLDALFGGLGRQEAEGAERDLCARGIREHFVWALRQASKGEMARHPGSVEAIMERVCVLIGHPQ